MRRVAEKSHAPRVQRPTIAVDIFVAPRERPIDFDAARTSERVDASLDIFEAGAMILKALYKRNGGARARANLPFLPA